MNMDNYRTKDLYEAAFLYASGKRLIQSQNGSGKIWFVFGDEPSCRALSDSFWRKEASVNAKEFADSIRTLKDLIFNRTSK
jgi:hypothetical protein